MEVSGVIVVHFSWKVLFFTKNKMERVMMETKLIRAGISEGMTGCALNRDLCQWESLWQHSTGC